MSEVKVNKISPRSGTAITLGDSGDTFTIPSGATLAIAGSVTGFTSAGIDDNATSVAITIDSSERVGIGNTSPTGALDVKSSTQPQLKVATASATADRNACFLVTASNSATPGARSVVVSLDADGGDGSGTDNLTITKTGGDGDATITNQNNAGLVFGTNNAEGMRLTSTGLGIGTTAPARQLTVSGSVSPVIAIVDTGTSGTPSLFFGDSSADNVGKIQYSNATNSLAFTVNSSERMNIANSGRVGINVTSASGLLHVQSASSGASVNSSGDEIIAENSANAGISILSGNSNQGQLIFGDDGDNNIGRLQYDHSNNSMQFIVNAAERMRITSAGSVGIGTASPVRTLDISDTTSGATTGIRLIGANNGSQVIEFADTDDVNVGYINYDHTNNRMVFRAGDNQQVYVDGSGSLLLGTTSNGSAGNGDLVVNGGIFLGGTGTANKLSDYEIGTWTPAIATAGGTLSVTYAERTGKYTKIGNVVYYEFYIETSAFSGGSGSITFSAFPFTVQAGRGAIGLATGSRVALGLESAAIIPDQNATTFKVRIKNSTGTGSSDNLTTLDASDWSNLNPTILYGAGYYRTDS
jgi:hypothetical protein